MEPEERNDDTNDRAMIVLMTRLESELSTVRRDVKEIKTAMAHEYVTRAEFTPVRNLVYGAVGMTLMAVLGAIVALVVM